MTENNNNARRRPRRRRWSFPISHKRADSGRHTGNFRCRRRRRKANKICLLFSLLSPFKLVFVLSIWRENNELSFSRSFSLCFLLSRCLFVHSLYWEIEMGVKRPCGWMFLIRTSSQNLVTQCLQLHNNNYCCCFLCINLLSDFNFVPFLCYPIDTYQWQCCSFFFIYFHFANGIGHGESVDCHMNRVRMGVIAWWIFAHSSRLRVVRTYPNQFRNVWHRVDRRRTWEINDQFEKIWSFAHFCCCCFRGLLRI